MQIWKSDWSLQVCTCKLLSHTILEQGTGDPGLKKRNINCVIYYVTNYDSLMENTRNMYIEVHIFSHHFQHVILMYRSLDNLDITRTLSGRFSNIFVPRECQTLSHTSPMLCILVQYNKYPRYTRLTQPYSFPSVQLIPNTHSHGHSVVSDNSQLHQRVSQLCTLCLHR